VGSDPAVAGDRLHFATGEFPSASASRSAVPHPQKSLDLKLARIVADPSCRDFILADAKDADMAFGLATRSGNWSPRGSSTSCS
jgi:hypothetical protein